MAAAAIGRSRHHERPPRLGSCRSRCPFHDAPTDYRTAFLWPHFHLWLRACWPRLGGYLMVTFANRAVSVAGVADAQLSRSPASESTMLSRPPSLAVAGPHPLGFPLQAEPAWRGNSCPSGQESRVVRAWPELEEDQAAIGGNCQSGDACFSKTSSRFSLNWKIVRIQASLLHCTRPQTDQTEPGRKLCEFQ